ncbi:hypothetical protein, partial [Klebsiella variicola]|uniref:hypothetical protein n=1 Tax=Klebsiella variicola TaxID=244366 RepID=UPI001BD68D74
MHGRAADYERTAELKCFPNDTSFHLTFTFAKKKGDSEDSRRMGLSRLPPPSTLLVLANRGIPDEKSYD